MIGVLKYSNSDIQTEMRSFGCSIFRSTQGQAGGDFEQQHLLMLVPMARVLEYMIFGLG